MQRMKNQTKYSTWLRGMAVVLLIACVTALLPSSILAETWSLREHAVAPQTGTNVVDTGVGTSTVSFKYFANKMYVEAENSTYTYYTFDPNKTLEQNIAGLTGGKTTAEEAMPTNFTSWSNLSGWSVTGTSAASSTQTWCTCTNKYTLGSHKCEQTSASGKTIELSGTPVIAGEMFGGNIAFPTATVLKFQASSSDFTTSSTDGSYKWLSSNSGNEGLKGEVSISVTTTISLIIELDFTLKSNITTTTGNSTTNCDGHTKYVVQNVSCTTKKKEGTVTVAAPVVDALTYRACLRVDENASTVDQGEIVEKKGQEYIAYSMTVPNGSQILMPNAELLKANIPANPTGFADDEMQAKLYASLHSPKAYYTGYTLNTDQTLKGVNEVSFPLTITEDVTIWVEWLTLHPDNKSLTDAINSKTNFNNVITAAASSASSDSYSPYVGTGSKNNLSTDKEYHNGYFFMTANTIGSGDTVKFCMNTGVTNVEAANGTNLEEGGDSIADPNFSQPDVWASLDYSGSNSTGELNKMSSGKYDGKFRDEANPLDYTVVLQTDLVIKGTMEIGGYTGAHDANQPMGNIIGHYVKLDLNGHTITIASGGKLHSYGFITDSKGTGKIIVEPNGEIATQMVVYDMNGGNQTVARYMAGFCPFEQYSFPYIETDVELLVNQKKDGTSSSGTGCLKAFTKLSLGSLGGSSIWLPLIASSGSLFTVDVSDTSKKGSICLKHKPIENALFSGEDAVRIRAQCLDQKKELLFNNASVAVSYDSSVSMNVEVSIASGTVTMYFSRVTFPVSSLLDISIENHSSFQLTQSLQLQPGCAMTVDETSKLIFNHAVKTFNAQSVSIATLIEKTTGYLAGSIFASDAYMVENNQYITSFSSTVPVLGNATAYPQFWTVMGAASLRVNGTLQLMTGTTESDGHAAGTYALGGNVSINQVQIGNGTPFKWTASNLNTTKFADVNFRSYNLQLTPGGGVALVADTSGKTWFAAVRYWAAPMHSNGNGYLFDTTQTSYNTGIVGTYDVSTGLLTASNGKYYTVQKTDANLVTNPSSAEKEINAIIKKLYMFTGVVDRTPTVWEVTPTGNNDKSVTYNGATYVYFAGQYLKTTSYTKGTSAVVKTQLFYSKTGTNNKLTLEYKNGYWTLKSLASEA